MKTKKIIKKQLGWTPSRFILGCIAPVNELSNELNPELVQVIEKERRLGKIEDVLSMQDFPEAPDSYLEEMGPHLATVMIILERGGSYTDLHHLKQGAVKIEGQFLNSAGGRLFNINPGAVGTYGICLASHKSTGGRGDSTTYAYGLLPHLFFGGETFYERIAKLGEEGLAVMERISADNRFPEYIESSRLTRFDALVRTLPNSDVSVDLL